MRAPYAGVELVSSIARRPGARDRRRGVFRALPVALLAVVLALSCAASAAASNVYVGNQLDFNVSQLSVGAGGVLTPLNPATVPAGQFPQAVAVSPDGNSVYVTNSPQSGNGTVWQYSVGAGGALSSKSPPKVKARKGAFEEAVSPNGRSLYVTNANSGTPSGGGTISQYDIGAGGELSPKNPAVVATPFSPAGIVVSPDGQSVYVASHALNVVSQYDVGAGGALSPKSPPTVSVPGEGPFAVAVSPDGHSLYVTGLATDNGPGIVSQYDIGAGGKLSPKSPPTVAAGATPTGVAVSPDGASAYVVDATGNDVLQYDVGAGGTLTPKSPPSVAAGMNPGKVALSADGHDAYVTNQHDNSVSQYTVGAGGALSPKSPATVPVGRAPFGIAVRSTLGTPPPPPTIGDVIASVQALGLPSGLENALLAKLNGAQGSLDAGQSGAACSALGAFVNQVEAQSGKKIAAGDAQSLTDQAAAVQQSLGCG